jgi:hypothetical protein
MADREQQAYLDRITARGNMANGNGRALPLHPVKEGKSWALSASVAASVLAAGGMLFGTVGFIGCHCPGSRAGVWRDYDQTRSASKTQVVPSAGLESADAAAPQTPAPAQTHGLETPK